MISKNSLKRIRAETYKYIRSNQKLLKCSLEDAKEYSYKNSLSVHRIKPIMNRRLRYHIQPLSEATPERLAQLLVLSGHTDKEILTITREQTLAYFYLFEDMEIE